MSRAGQARAARSARGALSGFKPWDALRAMSEARRFARKGMPPLELQELLVRHGLTEEAAARLALQSIREAGAERTARAPRELWTGVGLLAAGVAGLVLFVATRPRDPRIWASVIPFLAGGMALVTGAWLAPDRARQAVRRAERDLSARAGPEPDAGG